MLGVRPVCCVLFLLALSIQCSQGPALTKFADCKTLEAYLKEQAVDPRTQQQRQQPMPLLAGCQPSPEPLPGEQQNIERPPPMAPYSSSRYHTATNVREVSVDEADFVKNDGEYILILRDDRLLVIDAWPPQEMFVLADLRLSNVGDTSPFAMYYSHSQVLVLSRGDYPRTTASRTTPGTFLTQIDISDPGVPINVRQIAFEGSYLDSRRVDDQLVVVTGAPINWPERSSNPIDFDQNRQTLQSVTLEQVLPRMQQTDLRTGEQQQGAAFECQNTYGPEQMDQQELVVIHRLDLTDRDKPPQSTAVLTSWSQIYGSRDSLYLFFSPLKDGGYFGPNYRTTQVHKFSMDSAEGAVTYRASGEINGQLTGSFAVSEQKQLLRLVVSEQRDQPSNALVVLEQQGYALQEVGRVDQLGPKEFVQSVRFEEDLAYVVTYPEAEGFLPWQAGADQSCFFTDQENPPPRITGGNTRDPLWIVDLSQPTAPKILGELEVDGYSTYIHKPQDSRLLTIGVNTSRDNIVLGVALSLFDVSDPHHPELIDKQQLADSQGVSAATANHHAFTYFDHFRALAVPLQLVDFDCRQPIGTSGLEIYGVDAPGFSYLGRLQQRDLMASLEVDQDSVNCLDVRRSVMISQGEHAYVYAISRLGVSVASLEHGLPLVSHLTLLGAGEELCPSWRPSR